MNFKETGYEDMDQERVQWWAHNFLVSIKGSQLFQQMSNYQLLNKHFAIQISLSVFSR
jgi:hypothetical protein